MKKHFTYVMTGLMTLGAGSAPAIAADKEAAFEAEKSVLLAMGRRGNDNEGTEEDTGTTTGTTETEAPDAGTTDPGTTGTTDDMGTTGTNEPGTTDTGTTGTDMGTGDTGTTPTGGGGTGTGTGGTGGGAGGQ